MMEEESRTPMEYFVSLLFIMYSRYGIQADVIVTFENDDLEVFIARRTRQTRRRRRRRRYDRDDEHIIYERKHRNIDRNYSNRKNYYTAKIVVDNATRYLSRKLK